MISIVTFSRLMNCAGLVFWFSSSLFLFFGLPKISWFLKLFHTVQWRYLESFYIELGELSIFLRIPFFILVTGWILWQFSTLWTFTSRKNEWFKLGALCSAANLFASMATAGSLLYMGLACVRKAIDVTRMEPVEWVEVFWRFLQALF